MSDEEFISAFSGERNAGFNTAVGRKTVTEGNTIAACVHGTQTVSDGQALRLRLTEPMSVAGRFIPKGTVLVGGTDKQPVLRDPSEEQVPRVTETPPSFVAPERRT